MAHTLSFVVLLFLFCLPTIAILLVFGAKKELSVAKSVYILIFGLLQICLSIGVPFILDFDLYYIPILFILLSLLKSYLYCLFFKEKKTRIFILFTALDIVAAIITSWFFTVTIGNAAEEGLIPENLF